MKNQMLEFLRYIFFGIITTALNLFLLKVFIDLNIYYILANTIAYIMAVIFNYILNQKYVFLNSKQENIIEMKKQFTKFFLIRIFSLLIDNGLFYLFVTIFNFPLYWSKLILTMLIIAVTFLFNKFFVFVSKKE